MKKILLTATMLVGFVTIAQAQQGRVGINTTTPAATLDVVADVSAAGNAKPDALLIPRMSEDQLAAKNAAYTTTQNGAVVFVNAIDGATTAKTVNVTTTGFYYYDAPNNVWVVLGGGAAPATQRYEVIRGTATNVTAATYTVAANDYLIVTNAASAVTLTFPNLTAADAGRTVYVFNNNTNPAAANVVNGVTGSLTMNQFRGYPVLWTGSFWAALTK